MSAYCSSGDRSHNEQRGGNKGCHQRFRNNDKENQKDDVDEWQAWVTSWGAQDFQRREVVKRARLPSELQKEEDGPRGY
jgi:hypothetical protein